MVETVLSVVVGLLVLNLVIAAVVFARLRAAGAWLLVILLASTTGIALAAVLAVLNDAPRMLDAALVLAGTAVVTAAVRSDAERTRGGTPVDAEHGTADG
ncbi:hypothetical protein [Nesterenkonia aerolata]|uniref:Multicomponent Na+:H+ antiporter subunit F n=1 Tax=Nesterenkonia aerolata TaxID=3074079 RepID=A0ABU2DSH4_9MICC|nr:hypothetical protein [Nesterenkonia sp. LY-0111]MDR8019356.1 hypothetical protein [Nesterenkonia sp. LY-0111]